MTLAVSVSDFRDNIAEYLERVVSRGLTVVIKDEKRGRELVSVTARKKFDPVAYKEMLKKVAGTFSLEKHPEWSTLSEIEHWLKKERLSSERY